MLLSLKHITPLFSLLILTACSQPTEEPSNSEPAEEQAASAPKEKVTICFVGHHTSHGFGKHEYMAGCHLIEDWLKGAYPDTEFEGRYAVPWPEDEETFYADADAVVFFCSGGTRHVVNDHVAEFDKVMKTGAGLACLHYGVEVPIGPSAKGMLAWMGGYFEANWSVNPHWDAAFTTFTDHPAANGLEPFTINDEWYFHMRFVGDMAGVTPILSAIAPAETMSRKDGPHSRQPERSKGSRRRRTSARRLDLPARRRLQQRARLWLHRITLPRQLDGRTVSGRPSSTGSPGLRISKFLKTELRQKKPTKEFLDANALEFGGPQTPAKKKKPKPRRRVKGEGKPAPKAKAKAPN